MSTDANEPEGAHDARLIDDLRAWRATQAITDRWTARPTLDELDALLRAAEERDRLAADAARMPDEALEDHAEKLIRRRGTTCRYCGHYIVSEDGGQTWRHVALLGETGYHPAEPRA